MQKVTAYIIMTAMLLMLPVYAHAGPVIVDRIAASVEGAGVITEMELIQYAAVSTVMDHGSERAGTMLGDHAYMKSVLDDLIDRTLILKDARLLSMQQPRQADVDGMVARFRSRFKTVQAYDRYLQQYGLTPAYLNQYMTDSLIVRQYLNDEVRMLVRVSDAEVARVYENNKDTYTGMSRSDADKEIRAQLEQQKYRRQLKSWIKTLTLHREINILY